jgi:hypothetical protein
MEEHFDTPYRAVSINSATAKQSPLNQEAFIIEMVYMYNEKLLRASALVMI